MREEGRRGTGGVREREGERELGELGEGRKGGGESGG